MEKIIKENEFITITEDDFAYRVCDSVGCMIIKWYKEDFESDEDIKDLLETFEELIEIKDEEILIKELQILDSCLTNCYFDNAIDMFKSAYKYELRDAGMIAETMIELLDESKVNDLLLDSECINKIGKFYVYYQC